MATSTDDIIQRFINEATTGMRDLDTAREILRYTDPPHTHTQNTAAYVTRPDTYANRPIYTPDDVVDASRFNPYYDPPTFTREEEDSLRNSYLADTTRHAIQNEMVMQNIESIEQRIQAAMQPITLTDVENEILNDVLLDDQADVQVFNIQQNTAEREIRELRDQFPEFIFNHDFQQPMWRTLEYYRNNVRNSIRRLRSVQFAEHIIEHAPPSRHKNMSQYITRQVYEQYLNLKTLTATDAARVRTRCIDDIDTQYGHYVRLKQEYMDNKKKYGPTQARYNQRVAMIRQKPSIPKVIHYKDVVDTIMEWENVYAAAADVTDDYLYLRIGLSGIVMSDSAEPTAYDEPVDIRLAPFYFTIRVDTQGRFACQSQDRNAAGLSRERYGELYYDFHPHQLHDSPCFGSFGQSFIDMSNTGDMVGLISGLIAFYSQYNSQDSAGVSARYYHPEHLPRPVDAANYTDTLLAAFENFPVCETNTNKLIQAADEYRQYALSPSESAPCLAITDYCHWCEEEDVSDGRDYYLDNCGNRICNDCWADHYCADCENNNDNCTCDPDDRY